MRPVLVNMEQDGEAVLEILTSIKGEQTRARFPESSFLMMNKYDDYHYFKVDALESLTRGELFEQIYNFI